MTKDELEAIKKRIIFRNEQLLVAEVERLQAENEIQRANLLVNAATCRHMVEHLRKWSAAWKGAAKYYRHLHHKGFTYGLAQQFGKSHRAP